MSNMADNKNNGLKKGVGLHARRVIAYIVLIIITFFCLFWFYILFINATRSNGELQSGFQAFPSTHFMDNWKNLVKGTLPIWNGLFNSLIIATFSAILCVYFSTMTAYAIHAYDFKLKKYIYPFILAVMMIPTQVTALVLHNDKKKTLPILIAQLRAADWLKFDMGQVYVMIAFSIFPVIIVYLFLSRYIVQGVAVGSVKG